MGHSSGVKGNGQGSVSLVRGQGHWSEVTGHLLEVKGYWSGVTGQRSGSLDPDP